MKILKAFPQIVLIVFIFSSCSTSSSLSSGSNTEASPAENAILWHQTSAEYEALCIQSYNMARKRLEMVVSGNLDGSTNMQKAVVMDLDETVLDNSPYSVKLLMDGKEYSEPSWNEWVKREEAILVPGAKDFIEYATANGIEIFYISNRNASLYKSTLKNLIKLGIESDEEHIFLDDGLSKKERRDKITSSEIILLIGDNLADFSESFEKKLSLDERKKLVEIEFAFDFSNKFIILPNTLYGEWMNTIEREGRNRQAKLNLLRSY